MNILFGEVRHSMDGKNRIRIPSMFKSELTEGGEKLHFVQYTNGCIAIMNDTVLKQRFGDLAKLDTTNEEMLKALRFFSSKVKDVEEDTQGRVTLPKVIRDYIGADANHTELVTVGMINYIEIWTAETFDASLDGMTVSRAQELAKENKTANEKLAK